ncbi:MAG: cytochrome c biogenesis protein CcsA [Ignavibacteria bacterium]|jgi:ABC-type transport system involved in cytochrome c biogenesis permease subunit
MNIFLPILYLGTFAIYFYDFMKEEKKFTNVKRLFIFITLLAHICYLLLRTIEFDHPPITNVFEILTVLSFAITFSYFLLELITDIRGTGPFIIIISFVFQLISTFFIADQIDVKEVLKSNLLGAHVVSALLGYSGFTISAVYGLLYLSLYKNLKLSRFGLIFNRLPSLDVLEKLSFNSAVIGFILLTMSIIIGIIWLPSAFPEFSFLDPKLIATSIVWLVYGVGIFTKLFNKWKGKKIILLSITGFVIAILSTIFTNLFAETFHSFY